MWDRERASQVDIETCSDVRASGEYGRVWKVGRLMDEEYEFGIEISRWQPSV